MKNSASFFATILITTVAWFSAHAMGESAEYDNGYEFTSYADSIRMAEARAEHNCKSGIAIQITKTSVQVENHSTPAGKECEVSGGSYYSYSRRYTCYNFPARKWTTREYSARFRCGDGPQVNFRKR
jgi:hypothetical protein